MGPFAELLARYIHEVLVFVVFGAAILLLEVAFPRGRVSLVSRVRGAVLNLAWIAASVAAIFAVTLIPIPALIKLPAAMAWAGVLVFVVIGDLLSYWQHRLMHTGRFWPMHRTHHALREVSALNCFKHWTEAPIMALAINLPLGLAIGFGPTQWAVLFLASPLINIYLHSATQVHFGPVGAWLLDNRAHRIHHSLDTTHRDKNFGAIHSGWDRLFGTWLAAERDTWPETGVEEWNEAQGLGAWLIDPIRGR